MRSKALATGRGKSVFNMYFSQAKRYPWLLVLIFIGMIGIQIADLLAPLYLRKFFNIVSSSEPSSAILSELSSILLTILFVYGCGWFARRVFMFSISYFESQIMSNLLSDTFEYLIGHSYQFFINQFTGTLTRRVSKFAYAFETIFDGIVMQFLPTMFFVTGVVIVLFQRNHILGLILAGWAIFFVSFQIFVTRLRQPLRVARAEEDSRVVGMLSDSISNQNTITLFSGFRSEVNRFRQIVDGWRKATIRSWFADEYIWSIQGIFLIGINIGLLYGAVNFWKRGLLTVGDFVLIQSYLLGTFERLVGINRELRRFYDAFADASEMAEILETPHEIKDDKEAKTLKIIDSKITFRDVNFAFNKDRAILKDFSLEIRGGERVAFVGSSGAGKSTITKILLRLYDVTSGTIEIDEQDISKVRQESLRDQISFVPQEPLLFHRSLLENIRYGKRDATDEEVFSAAKKAHCDEFIKSFPDGYNTFVGERGVRLSGGERQRVAIARAILKNAPILILDEATSSLDSESEALIQDALETLMKDKTVLVIAHRLSTIMKMDRILVINDGRIVSEGSHKDLINQEGLYKKLWSIQAGGFISDEDAKLSDTPAEDDVDSEEEEKDTQIRYN